MTQTNQFVATALDHNLIELCWCFNAAQQANTLIFQGATNFAHRGCGVLGAKGIDHFGHRQIDFAQFLRMKQNAQFTFEGTIDIDLRHAGNAAELVCNLVLCQSRNFCMALAGGRQCQLHNRLRSRVNAQDDRFTYFSWQLVAHFANGIAHFVCGLNHVLFKFKEHQNIGIAFIGGAAHVLNAIDRLQGFLNAVQDLSLNGIGRCAGIADVDHQQGHVHIRNLVDFEFLQCHEPYGHEHEQNDDRDDRLLNAEVGQKHGLLTHFGGCVSAQCKCLTVF